MRLQRPLILGRLFFLLCLLDVVAVALHARSPRWAGLREPVESLLVERSGPGTSIALPRPPHYDYRQFSNTMGNWANYRISKSDFDSMPLQGSYEGLVSVMRKLAGGGHARIVALGGSETSGMKCEQRTPNGTLSGKQCAWPARLKVWLQEAFPRGTVELLNLAQGGSTTPAILAGLGLILKSQGGKLADIDAVLVDTLVNDCAVSGSKAPSREYRDAGLDGSATISLAYEQLVRTIYTAAPKAVVFSFIAGCGHCSKGKDDQLKVAEHYDLPRLDYLDLVESGRASWEGTGGTKAHHPDFRTHQYIADVIANAWGKAWSDAAHVNGGASLSEPVAPAAAQLLQRKTLWPEKLLQMFATCVEPLSRYSALASTPGAPVPSVTAGDWRLYEDRPGKPGWISEMPGSRIVFPVRFGKAPRLVVTWLRSYEHVGKASMLLNGRNFTLDGLWPEGFDEKVSLAHSVWFSADGFYLQDGKKQGEAGALGFAVPPNASRDIVFEVQQGTSERDSAKVKLLEVLSC